MTESAAALVLALEEAADDGEAAKIRNRVPAGEPVIGVRMGTLFALAKAATTLPDDELELLFSHPAYEPRMAAFCILDFRARRRAGDPELCSTYLRHHDRITAWDMVDRAAPRAVGGALVGGPYGALRDLAAASDPLRRRTAITAPLYFARAGSDADLAEGFRLAATLHDAPEPVVHNAVGIFLAHAGRRDADQLTGFLVRYADAMATPAVRLATRPSR